MGNYTAFTYRVPDNQRHSIVIDVEILVPVPIEGYPQEKRMSLKAKALIDTGASRSAICNAFIKKVKLSSYGKCTIRMAKGEYISSLYNVDIMFPNQMIAKNIKAAEFSGIHQFDFIVGMDILRMADMAISNAGGITVFAMRTPPADVHLFF